METALQEIDEERDMNTGEYDNLIIKNEMCTIQDVVKIFSQ